MVLKQRGKHRYGDQPADIRPELARYSALNGAAAVAFGDALCACGSAIFRLAIDESAGAAVRTCSVCRVAHPIGDSDRYLGGARLEECACPCGGETFAVTV